MNTVLVVITRPENKQAMAVKTYAAAGLETLSLPLLRTQICGDEKTQESLLRAQQANVLIFPSTAAVDACFKLQPTFAPAATSQVITVGPATARHWQQLQTHPATSPAQFNSEGVIALLESFSGVEQVCVITAPDGRNLVAEYCLERGINYQEIHVYQRVPLTPPQSILQQLKQATDTIVVTCTSVGTFQRIEAMLPFLSKAETVFVCASTRIANVVTKCGYRHVITADSASDQDMLNAVELFIKNR
ncbi:uroporphyrinogen-III synthase [Marinicella sp. W31]|uniref:uroporphyrinogen-III synthase n=1 Tax=Marinicella sp. W31 TaxID=3023713 RepID=UPI00375725BC